MPELLYDLELAEAALPLVSAIVSDALSLDARLLRARKRGAELRAQEHATQTELNDLAVDTRTLEEERAACSRELEDMGIRFADPKLGICDFPCELDGRRVQLCWRLGEAHVEGFHGVGEAHADRRPLPIAVPVE